MHQKHGSYEVLSVQMARGGNRGLRRALAKAGCAVGTEKIVRQAHRAHFEYEQRDGFLYVRSRAISSRCNDNFDEFPADEIKQAYLTFVGKPVFVNHHNENHRRARGVIIAAALHEDTNPDGSPDTWVEVLMEVDAVKFPKLAKAILAGEIDRTSMGTDVAFSICSACGNKAATPLDYCQHIPRMKGQRFERRTASGERRPEIIREVCYGLRFFENSLLVEEPADPTAFFLGVETGPGIEVTASSARASTKTAGLPAPELQRVGDNFTAYWGKGTLWVTCTDRGWKAYFSIPSGDGKQHALDESYQDVDFTQKSNKHDSRKPIERVHQDFRSAWLDGVAQAFMWQVHRHTDPPQSWMDLSEFEVEASRRTASKIAYGENLAPAEVDTLRDETCPVCGEKDSYNGDQCMVCEFIRPPDQFMDPDLTKAQQVDLRQNQQDANEQADQGELKCDSCGASFPTGTRVTAANLPGQFSLPKTKTEEDAKDGPQAGDACPTCGQGTLQATSPSTDGSKPVLDAFEPPDSPEPNGEDDEVEEEAASDSDGKGEADADPLTDEDDEDDEDDDKPFPAKKSFHRLVAAITTPHDEGTEVDMRPVLAAAMEMAQLERANREAITRIAGLAGVDVSDIYAGADRRIASIRRKADAANPAQPVPAPASEAPAATSAEQVSGLNTDDVTTPGATSETDVSPDATTSLDAGGTVLDPGLNLNQQDVTAPVAGTEGPRPTNEVRIETDVRAGTPSDTSPAFPLTGPFAEQPKVGGRNLDGRTILAMRLASLRVAAGIESGEQLAIATRIVTSADSDELIRREVDTLTQTVQAQARQPQVVAAQQAPVVSAPRQAPSLAPTTAAIGTAVGGELSSAGLDTALFEG